MPWRYRQAKSRSRWRHGRSMVALWSRFPTMGTVTAAVSRGRDTASALPMFANGSAPASGKKPPSFQARRLAAAIPPCSGCRYCDTPTACHCEGSSVLRTLIVDDEPLAIERMQVLCAELEQLQVVGTASDGASALRLAEKLKPDLLLLDMTMPGVDGLSVARQLGKEV